jgi:hypothetical protein
MRQILIGERIFVHGVPLDTSRFCPYCCATVDTACVTPRGAGSRTRTSARLTRPLVTPALRYPSETYVYGRNPASSLPRPKKICVPKLLDGLLEGVARAEGRNPRSCNLHLLACLEIPSLPGSALPHGDLPKPAILTSSVSLSVSVTTRSKASKCLWASLVGTSASWAILSISSVLSMVFPFWFRLSLSGGPLGLLNPVCKRRGTASHPWLVAGFGGTDPMGVWRGRYTTSGTSTPGTGRSGQLARPTCPSHGHAPNA